MTDRHESTQPDEDAQDASRASRPEEIEPERDGVEAGALDGDGADVDADDDEADVDADDADDDVAEERTERRSDVVIVTLVFVVLFAYQLYAAVSNLVGLPQIYEEIGISDSVPWAVLYAGVAVPAVAFAAASAVARGRRLAARAAILLLGLAVSAQLSLLLEELARRAAVAAFGG